MTVRLPRHDLDGVRASVHVRRSSLDGRVRRPRTGPRSAAGRFTSRRRCHAVLARLEDRYFLSRVDEEAAAYTRERGSSTASFRYARLKNGATFLRNTRSPLRRGLIYERSGGLRGPGESLSFDQRLSRDRAGVQGAVAPGGVFRGGGRPMSRLLRSPCFRSRPARASFWQATT